MEIANRLVKAGVVAAYLGTSPALIYEMARKGELPCVRISRGVVRFDTEAIVKWVAEKQKAGISA
jgi:excisionase family DNA binding protein